MEKIVYLDFIIDKLTNSIQNTISGDSFQTDVLRFTIKDSRNAVKGIDFVIESKPLTDQERSEISEYIANYKASHTTTKRAKRPKAKAQQS